MTSQARSEPDQQPDPSIVNRSPIFYGWIVWVVATLGIIATAPGQSFSVSLFIDHFIEDFDLSRTTVSSLYGLGTFIASLSLTWVGRRIDRHGNRIMFVIISALFALALMLWSLVTGPAMMLIGFIAIRGLGQGSLSLTGGTAIAQWFSRLRGRLSSFSFLAFSLFQSWYVPMVQNLLDHHDWRKVWIMLGVGVGVTIPALTWLLIRNRLEDFGLLPDGATPAQKNKRSDSETALTVDPTINEHNWTLSEAMHTAIFWVYLSGRIMTPTFITGIIFHQVSIFEELGYADHVAAETYAKVALFTAGISLLGGYLVDRLRAGIVLAIQLSALIAALGVTVIMTEDWLLIVYAMLLGLTMGSASGFDSAVWPNLFGRKHQGAIRGFVATTSVSGSAIGPIIFGLSYDHLGGYTPVLICGMIIAIAPAILALIVQKPTRRI